MRAQANNAAWLPRHTDWTWATVAGGPTDSPAGAPLGSEQAWLSKQASKQAAAPRRLVLVVSCPQRARVLAVTLLERTCAISANVLLWCTYSCIVLNSMYCTVLYTCPS